jgi:hypothetical protein
LATGKERLARAEHEAVVSVTNVDDRRKARLSILVRRDSIRERLHATELDVLRPCQPFLARRQFDAEPVDLLGERAAGAVDVDDRLLRPRPFTSEIRHLPVDDIESLADLVAGAFLLAGPVIDRRHLRLGRRQSVARRIVLANEPCRVGPGGGDALGIVLPAVASADCRSPTAAA